MEHRHPTASTHQQSGTTANMMRPNMNAQHRPGQTAPMERAFQGMRMDDAGPSNPPSYTPRPLPGRQYYENGIRYVDVEDPHNRVRTLIGTEPANRITEPGLLREGVTAHRLYLGTERPEEDLYPAFKLRNKSFFRVGRVLLMLWTEPAGETSTKTAVTHQEGITIGKHNERVFSKVRRFVVIREGDRHCSALPITTYGGQGVGKPVTKADHAIIFTGNQQPRPLSDELPARGEAGMRPISIRVVPDEPGETLDPMSRIDFAKVHTIHHNIKAKPFGMVHDGYIHALISQFAEVWPVLQRRAVATTSGRNPRQTPQSRPDDDETEGSESDDDLEAPQPQQRAPSGHQPANPTSPRAHAVEAQRAKYWQARWTQLLAHFKNNQKQTMEIMIRELMQSTPGHTTASAQLSLRTYLTYAAGQAQAQSTAGAVAAQQSTAVAASRSSQTLTPGQAAAAKARLAIVQSRQGARSGAPGAKSAGKQPVQEEEDDDEQDSSDEEDEDESDDEAPA